MRSAAASLPQRVAVGALFVWIADFFTLGIVLIFALIYLWARQELTAYEVIASVVLLALTAALTSVVMMGAWAPKRLYQVMRGAQRRANHLAERFHRQPLDEGWADRHSVELIQAGVAIAQHPKRLLWALAVALASHIVHILSVYTLFRAFHQQVSTGTLIAGFAIGMLFWIVAVTPQGIGVVEGAMTLTYASLGIPAATAAVVSLTYRGLTFWLPMAIGFVLLQRLRSFQGEPAPVAASNPDP